MQMSTVGTICRGLPREQRQPQGPTGADEPQARAPVDFHDTMSPARLLTWFCFGKYKMSWACVDLNCEKARPGFFFSWQ